MLHETALHDPLSDEKAAWVDHEAGWLRESRDNGLGPKAWFVLWELTVAPIVLPAIR